MDENRSWKTDLKAANSKLEFFDSGTQIEGSKPGDKWMISSHLKQNTAEWAKVLIRIYDHPMSFPGSISPFAGELLRALILNIAPKNLIEIGSYLGASAIWIASAMAEYERSRKLYCVDLFSPHTNNPWCPGIEVHDPLSFMLDNIKQCGLKKFIEVFKGDSREVIPKIAQQISAPFDFAVIDGDHSISGCLADFTLIEPLVATGGYILFHDMFPDYCGVDGPAYTLLNKIIPYNKRFEICQIYTTPINFGYAMVRKISE